MTARVRFRVCAAGLSAALLTLACAGPVGRIKDDAETDKVGNRSAGAATFQRLIDGAVHGCWRRRRRRSGRPPSASASPSSTSRTSARRSCSTGATPCASASIRRSTRRGGSATSATATCARRCAPPACARTTSTCPSGGASSCARSRPTAIRSTSSYATLSSGTTRDNAGAQRDYLLTLELVDVKSGEAVKVQEDVRKEYLR